MKTRNQTLRLIAKIAITGLNHFPLSLEDSADFYEGPSTLLEPPASEAAKYAATRMRECQRAEWDFRVALRNREGAD
jgi:hypothetical protein